MENDRNGCITITWPIQPKSTETQKREREKKKKGQIDKKSEQGETISQNKTLYTQQNKTTYFVATVNLIPERNAISAVQAA